MASCDRYNSSSNITICVWCWEWIAYLRSYAYMHVRYDDITVCYVKTVAWDDPARNMYSAACSAPFAAAVTLIGPSTLAKLLRKSRWCPVLKVSATGGRLAPGPGPGLGRTDGPGDSCLLLRFHRPSTVWSVGVFCCPSVAFRVSKLQSCC